MKSILPLVNELNNKNKKLEFLITTITITSAQLAKDEFRNFNNVHHRFFPIDQFFNEKIYKFMETKNNLFSRLRNLAQFNFYCKKNNILLAMLNARIQKKLIKNGCYFQMLQKKFS